MAPFAALATETSALGPESSIAQTIPTMAVLGFLTMAYTNGLRKMRAMSNPHHHLLAAVIGGLVGYGYTQAYNFELKKHALLKERYLNIRRQQREALERYKAEHGAEAAAAE
eukprot:Unigene9214_Nuclearia_a/m.28152 Unigene9214_Nuclearia_a/g.28152  ORF Unigene9214_Nuclearia_a/g.28152 Unigene9214_Nuclearia_a/m.28152 type:complete len:112 (+) Unigene9214_Nuclearia_a:47-382(+)